MNIRRHVAIEVQLYVRAQIAAKRAHEQLHLRKICSGAAWILEGLMESHAGWNQDHWVDYIIPREVVTSSSQVVTVRGFAVCGLVSKIWTQWAEPLEVMMHFSSTGRRMRRFEARLGDAALGMGNLKIGVREQLRLRAHPETESLDANEFSGRWLFEVSR